MSQQLDVERALAPRWVRETERELEKAEEALQRVEKRLGLVPAAALDGGIDWHPPIYNPADSLRAALVHVRACLFDLRAARSAATNKERARSASPTGTGSGAAAPG